MFKRIGEDPVVFHSVFQFDASDEINAEYITAQLSAAPVGTVVVIDYLQLLDQKRENPKLMAQVSALKTCANKRGLIMVFISQIDRSFDPSAKRCPGLSHVRLPNPLDLKLFTQTCFLHNGELEVSTIS